MTAEILELQSFVDRYFNERPGLRILEAGCGSSSYLQLGSEAHLTGLDISEKQLARNTRLDERILGDLQTHSFSQAAFDLIVCWDVLEHLPYPRRALECLFKAIKDDGLIVLAMPNVCSVKGQITKWTPHSFHVWVYRTLFGKERAGTDDHGPFKTYLRLAISPHRLRRFARARGFAAVFFRIYEANTQESLRRRFGLVNGVWWAVRGLTRFLTLGIIDASATDYIIILKRSAHEP